MPRIAAPSTARANSHTTIWTQLGSHAHGVAPANAADAELAGSAADAPLSSAKRPRPDVSLDQGEMLTMALGNTQEKLAKCGWRRSVDPRPSAEEYAQASASGAALPCEQRIYSCRRRPT